MSSGGKGWRRSLNGEFVALGCRLVTTDAQILAHYPDVAVRLADLSR